MNPAGIYLPGHSWLHRLPAGAKVAGLLLAVVVVLTERSVPWALGSLLVAAAVLASAGPPWRVLWPGVRSLALVLLVLLLAQWWAVSLPAAVVGLGRVGASVLLAWTVSMTTRVIDMLELLTWVLRPLRVVGVRPERVALTVALAIRSVPLLLDTVRRAQEARSARGAHLSPASLAVPVVVRSMRTADALGEALAARGHPRD